METMVRESWTDERLDDLTKHMDQSFDRVDARFDRVDARFDRVDDRLDRMDARFERLDGRLDSIQRTMAFGAIAMTTAFLAGFGGIAALIAAQL
jgi:archaellum component FlaC